jgi:DNA-binding response OmpR family regulator
MYVNPNEEDITSMIAYRENVASFGPAKQTMHINTMQWNAERRTVAIGNRTVKLTPIQYRLLFPLRHGEPVAYTDLAYVVYGCDVDKSVRVTMDKHVDRIRRKLLGTGVYIYCVLNYGYLLFKELESDEEVQDDLPV